MRRGRFCIRALCLGGVLLFLTACSSQPILLPTWTPPTLKEARAETEGLPFGEFADVAFRLQLLRYPQTVCEMELAEALGVRNDRLDDYSDAYVRETKAIEREFYRRLHTYVRQDLSVGDRLTYDAGEWMWSDMVAREDQSFTGYPISASSDSPHARLYARLISTWQLLDEDDVIDYIACLHQADRQLLQIRQQLLDLRKKGDVPPRETLDRVLGELAGLKITERWSRSEYLPDRIVAGHHPFFVALRTRLLEIPSIGVEKRVAYLAEAKRALESEVIPAYEKLYNAIVAVLAEATDDRIGIDRYPSGGVSYEILLRHYTGTDLTAGEIHTTALAAVERLRSEIAGIEAEIRTPSGRAASEVLESAVWDGATPTPEDITAEFRSAIRTATRAASKLTRLVPTEEVDVVLDGGVPGYVPAPYDGSRPAVLVVSSGDLSPPYNLLAIVHREVVPGRHLRVEIARESDLPAIRAWAVFPELSEGWATYAVDLASEIGLYGGDPLANLGRMQAQLDVAVSAAIDTGVHAFGWSFDRAVDYYVETTSGSEAEGQAVVKSCISSPGRSTSGLIGEMRILELRSALQRQQGESFDLAGFHDALLTLGNVPLPVAERWLLEITAGAVPADQ